MNKWKDEHLYNLFGKFKKVLFLAESLLGKIVTTKDTVANVIWSLPLFFIYVTVMPIILTTLFIPIAILHTIDWLIDWLNELTNKVLGQEQTTLYISLKIFMLIITLSIMFTWGLPYMFLSVNSDEVIDVVDKVYDEKNKTKDFKPINKRYKHTMI
jgi:hypothetical protein